jgi:hypothetical protein
MEVRCPHCLQYWYSDEEDAGKVRLCPDCQTRLRRGRRGSDVRAGPFLFTVAGLVTADVVLIALTARWPLVFGGPLVVFGAVLMLIGLAGLRLTMSRGHIAETDWTLARWPMLFALTGLACLLAFYTFVVRPARAAASPGSSLHQPLDRVSLGNDADLRQPARQSVRGRHIDHAGRETAADHLPGQVEVEEGLADVARQGVSRGLL